MPLCDQCIPAKICALYREELVVRLETTATLRGGWEQVSFSSFVPRTPPIVKARKLLQQEVFAGTTPLGYESYVGQPGMWLVLSSTGETRLLDEEEFNHLYAEPVYENT